MKTWSELTKTQQSHYKNGVMCYWNLDAIPVSTAHPLFYAGYYDAKALEDNGEPLGDMTTEQVYSANN